MLEYKIKNKMECEEEATAIIRALENKIKLQKTLIKNKRSGAINIKKINKELSSNRRLINTNLFSKKLRTENKHDVFILVDYSWSMGQYLGKECKTYRMEQAKSSLYSLGIVLNSLKVNFGVYGFCTDNRTGDYTYLLEIKKFKENIDKNQLRERINKTNIQKGAGQNNDAMAILEASKMLKKSGVSTNKKLLIVLSDGNPQAPIPDECTRGPEGERIDLSEATKEAIKEVNKSGIKTLAISLSSESNRFIKESEYQNKVYLNGENQNKFTKNLIKAYLNAIK